jgi:hypothetical protein
MLDKKRDRIGLIAFKKARQLDKLITELQNTTIGSLNDEVDNNTLNINNIHNTLTVMQTQIQSISNLFGITYNPDGTIQNENYTAHTHNYEDATISDTTDGSGVETSVTKESGGVNTQP